MPSDLPPTPASPAPAVPNDSRLVPLFPLVYVAWSDGVLTAAEVTFLRERLEASSWLGLEGRAFLDRWLNPERPPGAEALQDLLHAIERHGAQLPRHERRSLARLGMQLARTAPDSREGTWPAHEVMAALEEVEEMLGVVGTEAARELLDSGASRDGAAGADARSAPVLAPLPSYEASFTVAELRDLLDRPYGDVRDRVRSILSEPDFGHAYGLSKEEQRERVLRWLQRLAREGLGSLGYPEEYGGGDDMGRAMAVFETLAHHDLSLVVKYGVQFGLFGGSILQLGTSKHHERYLERVGRSELLGCFAMTETGHGSNVRSIATTAVYDAAADEFVIHTPTVRARKDYIGNAAAHGRLATVFAQLQLAEDHHGVHAFLVPIRDESGMPLPGVAIEDCGEKEGLNGVDNGRLTFEHVRIPRENLLDRFGRVDPDGTYSSPIASTSRRFYTMLGTLVTGRISIAAAAVSAAKTGLAIAVRYGDRRRQFGPAGDPEVPILDYRVHQRRLLPHLAASYGLTFAARDLVHRYLDADQDGRREVEVMAGGLKAYASDHAVETLQACRELCGGQGYLSVNRFGRLKADVDVFTTFEGANPVLLQLVAKGLLTNFKEEFAEMRAWGIMRDFAGRTLSTVVEKNPLVVRQAREEHLRGESFQSAALAYREDRLLRTVALRLRGRIRDGMDSFAAMNQVQDHLVALANAHVERVIHDSFARAIEAQPQGDLRRVLDRLRDLWVLSRIEHDRGWFLECGYISPAKSKGIRQQVNDLCSELRSEARALVDAFGIPDPVLAAPIALTGPERSED